MNKKFLNKCTLAALTLTASFTACSSDNDPVINDNNGSDITTAYIFTGTNSEGTANYIADVPSLDEGETSIVGNGLETFTGTEWFTYKDKYLFRLQYNQGNNGGTSAYFLNSLGQIEQTDYTFALELQDYHDYNS